ncbi:MAG: hypothetical protein R3220_10465 [Balneolaceae bacterium]|nr:hypothetical protein [Balneolaceae bacterium]
MIGAALFFLGFLFQAHQVDSVKPEVEPNRQDSVQTEMILRSEDLIWKTGWDFFSIDRMSYKVNSGYYGLYGPQPSYMLDGIPFDPTFFGMNFSQLVPVSFNQIQALKPYGKMGTHEGVVYSSGLLNLQSVPLKKGLSVVASGQFGHNSDEPGPWIFDKEQVTPNVERFGPWVDAGAAIKLGNWYAKALLRMHRYLNINPYVQTRTKNLVALPDQGTFPEAVAETNLGLAETGFRGEKVDLRIQAIQTESEEFLYFQPLAREIPTEFSTEQYSASGSFLITKAFGIRTMAQYRNKTTGYRRNQFDQRFDWNQEIKTGRASVYLDRDSFRFDIGTEYRETETNASGMLEDKQQYVDLFLDQQIDITSRIRFGSYSAVTLHEEEKPVQAKGFLEIDLLDAWTTAFGGSYSELLPEISNPIDLWLSRRYDILNRLGSYVFVPKDISNTRLYTLSNRHKIVISDLMHVELDAEYINHTNFHIPFQFANYYLALSTTPGGYFLFDDQSGQRFKLSLATDIKWSNTFEQTLGIYWSKTIDGDVAYQSYWKTTPEYLVRHSSILNPFQDLEIRLNIQYQTETVWDEFQRLDGELNRTFHPQFPYRFFEYSNKIPATINIDLILSKLFWEQRLRAFFMLSNLFNQKYRTHPIGTQEGFGYMLRLELRL